MLQHDWFLSVKTTCVGVTVAISHPWEGYNTFPGRMQTTGLI